MSRFARTADLVAARQDARAAELAEQVRVFVQPESYERALDVGTGAGALALALAPSVAEVVGVDVEPELLARARERAASNTTFEQAEATALPFPDGSFDFVGTLRTLHHVYRPELAVAEITRVTRLAGRVLIVDQLAPLDPLDALEIDRFERARDPDHQRLLSDHDFRQLFEANRLVLEREQRRTERRDLADYLDHAACEGDEREQALALAPHGRDIFVADVAWYLLRRL